MWFIENGVNETTENEAKEEKVWFLGILLLTVGAGLLGNMLIDKGVTLASEGELLKHLH